MECKAMTAQAVSDINARKGIGPAWPGTGLKKPWTRLCRLFALAGQLRASKVTCAGKLLEAVHVQYIA